MTLPDPIPASAKPQVSVLMTVYNGQSFLQMAIESVLNQDFRHFELIIINDASDDASGDIIQALSDPRIRSVYHAVNQGIAKSLNEGLSLAQAAYIAILDQDDLARPGRLSTCKAYLDVHPEVGMLGSDFRFMTAENKLLAPNRWAFAADHLAYSMLFGNPVCHPSCMYRKALALQVGGYDPEDGYAADYGLTRRIQQVSKVINIDEVLTYWRIHPGNTSKQNRVAQLQTAQRIAHRAMCDLMREDVNIDAAHTVFEVLNLSPYPVSDESTAS